MGKRQQYSVLLGWLRDLEDLIRDESQEGVAMFERVQDALTVPSTPPVELASCRTTMRSPTAARELERRLTTLAVATKMSTPLLPGWYVWLAVHVSNSTCRWSLPGGAGSGPADRQPTVLKNGAGLFLPNGGDAWQGLSAPPDPGAPASAPTGSTVG